MRRTLDEIAEEAAEIISPPDHCKKVCRDVVKRHIELLGSGGTELRRNAVLASLEAYRTALYRAKTKAEAVAKTAGRFGMPNHAFIDLLADELARVTATYEIADEGLAKQNAAHPRDVRAALAAQLAYGLLDHESPWRRIPTLTEGGPWLQLSGLLYEAATGKEKDLREYCRSCRRHALHGGLVSHPKRAILIPHSTPNFSNAGKALTNKFWWLTAREIFR
jgi:hypothetical protein